MDEFLNMLKNPKNLKWFIIGVVVAILIAIAALQSSEAKGKRSHNNPSSIETTEVTNVNITNINSVTNNSGVASALALGQCQYDYTYSLQGCVGFGFSDSDPAIAFGLAKRSDEVLISGGLALEESGDLSGAVGLSWKF